ncbi:hypothetical protein HPB51_008960 [Rhipicephalus microplus]|uniref:Uncharacterized protein n=1 Tax=Rhipicephalus microplus TaxID=6941 RepID=A0A9J6D8V4_RHIMP|nr:hypothetical protein HPB51_008960 [Rhipicephalus microplus]
MLAFSRSFSYRLLECSGRRGVGDKHLTKCETCGIAWDPSSVKIRTKPRLLLRRSIRKLLAKERHRPWLLNSRQKKLLKRFNRATTMLVSADIYCLSYESLLFQVLPDSS